MPPRLQILLPGQPSCEETDCCALAACIAKALCEALARLATDAEILDIHEASRLLRCAVDTVRRIPAGELPVYRVGKANLYLREDLIAFVRSKRRGAEKGPGLNPADIDALIDGVLKGDAVEAREPSRRRLT